MSRCVLKDVQRLLVTTATIRSPARKGQAFRKPKGGEAPWGMDAPRRFARGRQAFRLMREGKWDSQRLQNQHQVQKDDDRGAQDHEAGDQR